MRNLPLFLQPLLEITGQFDRYITGRLWLKVLIALFLGVLLGIALGPDLRWVSAESVKLITAWLALPGQLFLAIIQMIVVPLVLASVVRGLAANNNPTALKKNGLIAIIFIFLSTAIAAALGIVLALYIEPGNYINASNLINSEVAPLTSKAAAGFPSLSELPRKVSALIPTNPLASMASGEMLQVILFAAVLGAALLSIPAQLYLNC
ncbi:dicarboxylate/amino acid:cation symporter [Pseudoalteromonas sp. S16_S37]|uniref:dicarboxylate/amino acid:cation symporter n=1 Tax=Pseudoalteromonas sp. S16_S37 TaxID=2720228 RepID=UPI00237C1F66|nr:cation:dicarboxylase symporter family transporter [Pseudoalteromonas sp. S16_S37]